MGNALSARGLAVRILVTLAPETVEQLDALVEASDGIGPQGKRTPSRSGVIRDLIAAASARLERAHVGRSRPRRDRERRLRRNSGVP